MIIYGWGYFNRRNYSLIRKGCGACGYYGYHQGYECSRFATLYFVPVIPLGSQHIISECPKCKHAEGLSKRKWKRIKKKELPAIILAYEAEPKDREAAQAALSTSAQAQSKASALQIIPIVRANFPKDAEMEGLIASVLSYLCMDDDADQAFLTALELGADEDTAKESELHMQARSAPIPKPKNRLLQSLPVLIVPLVLMYFFGSYLSRSFSSEVEKARLVNGLSVPYQVNINGRDYTIGAYDSYNINNIEYGLNRIDPVEGSVAIEPVEFEVSSPWSKRASNPPYVVINPDRAAIIVNEVTEYAASNHKDDTYEIFGGESAYQYKDLDYFFTEFPDEIRLPSQTSRVLKTRVYSLNDFPEVDLIQYLMTDVPNIAPVYLESKLALDPNSTDLIAYGNVLLEKSVFLDLTRKHLNNVPVMVEWHRFYQDATKDANPNHDLVTEYTKRKEQSPNDPALVYLLARITPDIAHSVELFHEASKMANSDGYSANALAYHYLLEGDFSKSLKHSDIAIKKQPGNLGFLSLQKSASIAAKDVGRMRAIAAEEFSEAPYSMNALSLQLLASKTEQGDKDLNGIIDDYCERLRKDQLSSAEDIKNIRSSFDLYLASLKKDRNAYINALKQIQGDDYSFEIAVLEGRYAAALEILKVDPENISFSDGFILFARTKENGDQTTAEATKVFLIDQLSNSGEKERMWAQWLQQETPPEFSTLVHESKNPDNHFIVLTAFAMEFPSERDRLLEHAKKICYTNGFGALALTDLL